jgi:hypothetical protein
MALLPMLAVMLPLALFKKLRGWQLCLAEEDRVVGKTRLQFSLRQMLAWTTGLGILFGLARWMAPDQMQHVEDFGYEEVLIYSLMIVILLLFFLPVFISFAGSILSQNRRRTFVIWTIFLAPLSAFLFFTTLLLVEYWQNQSVNNKIPVLAAECAVVSASMFIAFLVTVSGTLVVLRYCGYRLVRLEKRSSANEVATLEPSSNAASCGAPRQQPPRDARLFPIWSPHSLCWASFYAGRSMSSNWSIDRIRSGKTWEQLSW